MADHVLMGAFDGTFVIRTSLPGFDVKNTGLPPESVSFDSRWPEIGNVLVTGEFRLSGTSEKLIYFGTTFTAPPLVILHMSGVSNDTSRWYLIDGAFWYDFNVSCFVYKDLLRVQKGDSNNLGPSERTFRYIILRNFYA